MRICIMTDFFVPHYQGGGERRYYEILKRLVKKGHHVDLICMRIKGVGEFENIDGIHVHHIGPTISQPPKRGIIDFIRFVCATHLWLIRHSYDLIEANPWISMIPVSVAGILKREKVTAVIHDISSGKEDQWMNSSKTAELIEKFLIRLPFDKIICVSKGVKDRLVKNYGLKREKIELIHNGVDISLMDSIEVNTKEENTVIFIGRLIPHKHVDDLIRAIGIIRAKLPGVRLKIIGAGQEMDELMRLVGELKLEKQVKFFGAVDYTDLVKELKKSNLLVLPSTREGFGMVLVEAYACRVPCVAYYSDGVVDVIDNGKNGFLIKQREVDKLAEKIHFLLKNKARAMLFARNGRAKTEKQFGWDRIAAKVERFYKSLIR